MARSFYLSKLWQSILTRIGVLETYQGTIPPAEDYNTVADIRVVNSLSNGDRVFCLENQIVYVYDATSTAADNGSTILKPNSIGSGSPGRWVMEQQLALKNHTHTDKADKLNSPLQTRFLQANAAGNPVEGPYGAASFAMISHTHAGYVSSGDIEAMQGDINAIIASMEGKMDKPSITSGDVGKPAVFVAGGNVSPGSTLVFHEFQTGALVAGVTKTVSHDKDLAIGYIINARSPENDNNATVSILKPNVSNPSNAVDVQSGIDIAAPGLTIQILGA